MSFALAEEKVVIPDGPRGDRRALRRRLSVVVADLAALALAVLSVSLWSGNTIGVPLLVVFPLAFFANMIAARLYNSRLVTDRREELGRVVRSGVRATLILGMVAAAVDHSISARSVVALVLASIVLVLVDREIFRAWFRRRRRKGHSLWGTVLVADRSGGEQLREAIKANHTSPYQMVEHVCPSSRVDGEALLTEVLSVARATKANGVIVVESSLDTTSTNFLVRGLLEAGLYVDLASALSGISTNRLATRSLGPSIATWIEPRPRHGWRAAAKRAFDIVVASIGLLAAAPLFAGVALAVKLTSPGPIFFRQERVGRNGEPFKMMKFRSMVIDAEERLAKLSAENEGAGPLFKMKDDPRITKIGGFIRKTSLDELPQLLNVLKNEMSLVGPRPALKAEMAEWHPDLYARLHVQPGITGMWQVSGRSSASFDEYTRLDLYYVHNWSLFEDLTILAKTVPAVIKSDGAY